MFKKSSLTLLMAIFAVFMVASCSGGGSGSSGNTISGSISLSGDAVNASVSRTALDGDGTTETPTETPYVGATVQLILIAEDGTETVVDETTTDEDGKFEFENVAEGTYEVVILDPDTGEEVTRVPVPLVDGDDATVDGAVSTDGTDWTIDFDADDGTDEEFELQNEEQTSKMQNIALAGDVEESEVFEMRTEGKMGWGKIAMTLGVHPSVLGLGYKDDDGDGEENEFESETTTTTNSGSIGSNSGSDSGSSDSDSGGKGGGKGKPDNAGNGNGNSGNNGGGNGNSGNNGNGKPEK